MPVQINEVIIKAVVGPVQGKEDTENCEASEASSASDDEIMEKVFEIIQEKKER